MLVPSLVALRKESVDRKNDILGNLLNRRVALRKESVDRKTPAKMSSDRKMQSLSARRAWIEKYVI